MSTSKRREPTESVWKSGPSFRWGSEPPSRYKTIMDFEIGLVLDPWVGLQMEWRSATHGLLTPAHCFVGLEDPNWRYEKGSDRLVDGWRPVGTPDRAFIEIDQGFLLAMWADRGFVHVEYGREEDDQGFLISTWYRVMETVFDVAWADMLRRLRSIHAGDVGDQTC
jgi:hypothetical protein